MVGKLSETLLKGGARRCKNRINTISSKEGLDLSEEMKTMSFSLYNWKTGKYKTSFIIKEGIGSYLRVYRFFPKFKEVWVGERIWK